MPFLLTRLNRDISSLGKKAELYERNDPDWIPSVHINVQEQEVDCNAKVVRFQHQQVRLKRKHEARICIEKDIRSTGASSSYDSESSNSSSVDCATSPKDIAAATNAELQYLRNENTELRNNLESLSYNMSAFEGNDDKVLLLTGLQKWSILQSLYNYLCP